MNLILLKKADFLDKKRARLPGRAAEHVRKVLKAGEGDTLHVGLLNGKTGTATILKMNKTAVEVEVLLNKKAPDPAPLKLILALPRPIVLKRLLAQITALGIKDIVVLHTNRVEKSYWSSPLLSKAGMEEQLLLGLEQAKDTMLPQVLLRKRFKPFVEDELKDFIRGTTALLAHPGAAVQALPKKNRPLTLVVGPEGGFIPYEVDLLQKEGCIPIALGTRILKVETAVVGWIGALLFR